MTMDTIDRVKVSRVVLPLASSGPSSLRATP